jgi:hypothetical protein
MRLAPKRQRRYLSSRRGPQDCNAKSSPDSRVDLRLTDHLTGRTVSNYELLSQWEFSFLAVVDVSQLIG